MIKLSIINIFENINQFNLKGVFLYGDEQNKHFTLNEFQKFYKNIKEIELEDLNTEINAFNLIEINCFLIKIDSIKLINADLIKQICDSNYFIIFSVQENIKNYLQNIIFKEFGYLICYFNDFTISKLIDKHLNNLSIKYNFDNLLQYQDIFNQKLKNLIILNSGSNVQIIFNETEKILLLFLSQMNQNNLNNSINRNFEINSDSQYKTKPTINNLDKIISKNAQYSIEKLFQCLITQNFSQYFLYLNYAYMRDEPIYILRCFLKFIRQILYFKEQRDEIYKIPYNTTSDNNNSASVTKFNISSNLKTLEDKFIKIFPFTWQQLLDFILEYKKKDILKILDLVNLCELEYKKNNHLHILTKLAVLIKLDNNIDL